MTEYTFAGLVGDEKTFFAEYFDKKPMLRKKALPGDPREVLSLRRLDELVNLEVIRPPYIKVNLKGDGVPEMGYTRNVVVQGATVTDAVDPEKIYELFRAGATVTWCSLNQIVPELRDFTRIISDKMAVRTDSVAFLTPSGKKGYPPHHDPVDLFIVQLEGTKHWRLWNPPAQRLGDNGHYTLEGLGEPAIEVSLEPGDVLYLPYGTPHAATAEGQASLHLSIMMRPRMWRDLLQQTFEEVVQDAEFTGYPHIGELRDSSVGSLFKEKILALAARMESVDAEAELDRLAERGRHMDGSSSGNTFQTVARMDGLGPDAQLRRTSAPVVFGPNVDGRTQMTVSGHKIAVPSPVAETLAALGSGMSIAASQVFPGVDAVRSTKAAQGLTRLGVFELAAAG
ncbi:ribosomal protein L16 Arg81 hydroxylase [Streptacidiphilus sp. MAP12-16]|jgi:ribosomal protein L16 Arg81 hydroxylase|uniref:cupin domain-containing protein n=1 Tax=Streptacidiphilus sp. MAP12-16 TaxID=3156300 RepID=UPI0035144D93